jgi:hypothetical protein
MLLLIAVFLFTSFQFPFPTQPAIAATGSLIHNTCYYDDAVDGMVPPGVWACSLDNKKFNSAFYNLDYSGETHVVAYGQPFGRFAKGYLGNPDDAAGTYNVNGGRWTNNGVLGEYEYYGSASDGSQYSNPHIKNTSDKDGDQETNRWIWRPWVNGDGRSSDHGYGFYNDNGSPELNLIKANISRSYGFNIKSGVENVSGTIPYPGIANPYDFSQISQAPSLTSPGTASMWHVGPTKVYVQSFELNKLVAGDKQTPNLGGTYVLDEDPIDMASKKFTSTIDTGVTINGVLEDGNFWETLNKMNVYTRYDIKSWKLEIMGQSKDVMPSDNRASAPFDIQIPVDQINASDAPYPSYTTTAKVTACFNDNTCSFSNMSVKFRLKNLPQTTKSIYDMESEIQLANKTDYAPSMVKFVNKTIGTPVRYTTYVKNNTTNETVSMNSATAGYTDLAANNFISNFIDQKFVSLIQPTDLQKETIFTVSQDAFDKFDQSTRDTHTIKVKYNPDLNNPVSISIEPNDIAVPKGGDKSVIAWAHYANGKEANITNVAAWAMADTSIATVSGGNIHGVAVGLTTISASWKGKTSGGSVTVANSSGVFDPNTGYPDNWDPSTGYPPTWDPARLPLIVSHPSAPIVTTTYTFDPPAVRVTPDVSIPIHGIDIVGFPASDATTGAISRSVIIDGASVDDVAFFSGTYKFGIGNHGQHSIQVYWTSVDDLISGYSTMIYIHDSKPVGQFQLGGINKENRKMTATNNSDIGNDAYVLAQYPLTYNWTWSVTTGDGASLKIKTDTPLLKEFMYKTPGTYKLSITASNGLGRVSDVYAQEFTVNPDVAAAIVLHAYQSQVARTQKVHFNYSVISTDGDQVATQSVEIYKDNVLIQTITDPNWNTFDPAPFGLGDYKVVGYAKESTTQATYPEFNVGNEDKVSAPFTTYFTVDNLSPISDMYVNTPVIKPVIDAFFMLDQNLNQPAISYVNGNGVTIRNNLVQGNIDPAVGVWDMKTYDYTQPASTTQYYGSSSPPASIPWSSPPYSGTLNKVGGDIDGGYTVNSTRQVWYQPSSYTETYQISAGWTETITTTVPKMESGCCNPCWGCHIGGCQGGNNCPSTSTMIQNGTTTSTSTVYHPAVNGTRTVTPSGYYVNEPYSYYQYNWGANYSGTLHNYVRQPYDNSWMRTNSKKYVVYMSDTNVSQPTDLQNVLNMNTSKLILVGNSSILSQGFTYVKFIDSTGKPIDQLVTEIQAYIASTNTDIEVNTVLIGTAVKSVVANTDAESDPITSSEMMITQDSSTFDNALGQDTFAGETLQSNKALAQWHPYTNTFTVSKPGVYNFYRRIKDHPTADGRFDYYSNASVVRIVAHRAPIANFSLDFDYTPATNDYGVLFVDMSKDLDHEFNRADKGIIATTLTVKNNGTGVIQNKIPSRLAPGSYTATMMVQDVESTWSAPYSYSFTLASAPPVQMDANVNPAIPAYFSMGSIPASESLVATNQWTRYPYTVSLHHGMFQSGVAKTTDQVTAYYTGTKVGNDIDWLDKNFNIPATLADGSYTFTIGATGQFSNSQLDFPVVVSTPVNMTQHINASYGNDVTMLVVNYPFTLMADTTKYATSLTATMFQGTAYQVTIGLTPTTNNTTGIGSKTWMTGTTIPAMPDGTYRVVWTATTPSGKSQQYVQSIPVVNNRPPVASFKMEANVAGKAVPPIVAYRNDTLLVTTTATDPDPGDAALLSYMYTFTSPTGVVTTSAAPNPTKKLDEVGTWTIKQVATDPKGASNAKSTTVAVQNLVFISNIIDHTAKFKQNLIDYNIKNPTTPRINSQFWVEEAYDLTAKVTDTTTSWTKVSLIQATLKNSSGTQLNTVLLSSSDAINWNNIMDYANTHPAQFPDGTYTITFTANWNNGYVMNNVQTYTIKGSWTDYANTFRVN